MKTQSPDRRLAPGEDGDHVTFCRICEAFCGMVAKVEGGRIVKLGPDRLNPHSTGHICVKGPSIREVAYDPDRITRPMRRVGGPGEFEPVGWDEALDDIAARLLAVTEAHGSEAGALYTGNPVAYASHLLLTRGIYEPLGLSKVFSAGSQDVNPRLVASWLLYGAAGRLPIPDLPSCDFLMIFGANPLVSHGSVVTAPRIREDLEHIAARGQVVVVDPRLTETAEKFDHVSIRPDTDAWMLAALVRLMFEEGGADLAFLEASTTGWRELRAAVSAVTPERAEAVCGVPADRIRALARSFAGTDRAAVYTRAGLCRGQFSTLASFLGDALNIVAGKFGRPGCWVFGDSPIDTGAIAVGYEPSKTRIADLPTVGGKIPTIVLPQEMLAEGEGRVRALALVAGNPMLSAPGGQSWGEALAGLDICFAIDLYMNETNRHAHYILPAATFLEREDVPLLGWNYMVRTFAQYTDAVIPPLGEARTEHEILHDLGGRVRRLRGEPLAHAPSLAAVLDPLFAKGAAAGRFTDRSEAMSLDDLKAAPHGIMLGDSVARGDWPAKVLWPEGRISLWGEVIAGEFQRMEAGAAEPSGLRMIGRRELRSINSWMHNVDRLVRSQKPSLLIHPADALAWGISTGDRVRVRSENGVITVRAEVSDDIRQGVVSYPHGWGHDGSWGLANAREEHNVNLLVATRPEQVEQVSGASYLDGFAVTLERVADDEHQAQE